MNDNEVKDTTKTNEGPSEQLGVNVVGTVLITDDLGNELLKKKNAIHPRNMARVIARALAHEGNSFVHRIAMGNGGTLTDASLNITFRTPNDGVPPDTVDWRSRLYNETYSEIVDNSSSQLGIDPGSSDSSGTRSGGGSIQDINDGSGVRSNDLGNTSEVVITAIIAANEPANQVGIGVNQPSNGAFVFDELGLYTSGASASEKTGYVNVTFASTKNSTDVTNLTGGITYDFQYSVDGGSVETVELIPPSNQPTFGELVQALNTNDPAWSITPNVSDGSFKITDDSTLYPTTTGAQTFGFLQFVSHTSGTGSSVTLENGGAGSATNLILALDAAQSGAIQSPVQGSDSGVENSDVDAEEGERLLTHLIFQPISKSAERQITISYTLTVSVGRTT